MIRSPSQYHLPLPLDIIMGLCLFSVLAFAQSAPAIQAQSATPSQVPAAANAQKVPATDSSGEKVTVMSARITHMVRPKYPEAARREGIEGTVVLAAIIGVDGRIRDLKYVSGPNALIDSAMHAVHQWRYATTKLNGKPVEVDTTISVVFQMN